MRTHIFREQASMALDVCDSCLACLLDVDIDPVALDSNSSSKSGRKSGDGTRASEVSEYLDDSFSHTFSHPAIATYRAHLRCLVRAYVLATLNPVLCARAYDTLDGLLAHLAKELTVVCGSGSSSNTDASSGFWTSLRTSQHPLLAVNIALLELARNVHPYIYSRALEVMQKWVHHLQMHPKVLRFVTSHVVDIMVTTCSTDAPWMVRVSYVRVVDTLVECVSRDTTRKYLSGLLDICFGALASGQDCTYIYMLYVCLSLSPYPLSLSV